MKRSMEINGCLSIRTVDSTVLFGDDRTSDKGNVRMGAQSPAMPSRTTDDGKVRMGAQSPAMPKCTLDSGNVRMGAQSPALPPR